MKPFYAIGVERDKTLKWFIEKASSEGHNVIFIDLHKVLDAPWCMTVPAVGGPSTITTDSQISLDPEGSYYNRIVDLSLVLPEPFSRAWRNMIVGLSSFLETVPGIVVNRPNAHLHNGAKPYHEWWIARHGFSVPPAITTSDKNEIINFLSKHGIGIVKALCGMRGTAQKVTATDFENFIPEQGPVHVQKLITGFDVRVHVIGEHIHAEKIETDAIDYRERGADTNHKSLSIPASLKNAMISASAEMKLAFTGWDFKVDADGQFWCLEVNPMPGYDSYDRRAGGVISKSIIEYLTHDN